MAVGISQKETVDSVVRKVRIRRYETVLALLPPDPKQVGNGRFRLSSPATGQYQPGCDLATAREEEVAREKEEERERENLDFFFVAFFAESRRLSYSFFLLHRRIYNRRGSLRCSSESKEPPCTG
ncbi:hypothetical protein GW17_00003911 [Ensete ventricosum]|nr:hypothetical protein GW17_00003911 [Ensete ventricosum]